MARMADWPQTPEVGKLLQATSSNKLPKTMFHNVN